MPEHHKPSQYISKIEREFERLWVNKTSVLILSMGKDVYSLTDGNRGARAKGHILLRQLKKLPDKAGYSKLWDAFKNVEGVRVYSTNKLVFNTHEG